MPRYGESIQAECHSCGKVYIHSYCASDHKCENCGEKLNCGYPECEQAEEQRKAHAARQADGDKE